MHFKEINIRNRDYKNDFDYLIKAEKIETKSLKDLTIYFTRYDRGKSKRMLSLYYHELMGKINKHEGKKYLMVDNWILDKVLNKIKGTTSIEKFDDTKILI